MDIKPLRGRSTRRVSGGTSEIGSVVLYPTDDSR
jgi:hypothetical protein